MKFLTAFCIFVLSLNAFASINDDFLNAVRSGDAVLAEQLLRSGANVNTTDSNHTPALVLATDRDDHRMVETMLYFGPVIDARDRNLETALMRACTNGNLAITESLLTEGANPSLGISGADAVSLFRAVEKQHLKIVQLLIAHKVNIQANYPGKNTALHQAARIGGVDIISELINAGIDKDCKTWEGATPLILSSFYGKLDAVIFLINANVDLDAKAQNKTALGWAKDRGYSDVIKVLEAAGAKE